MGRSVTLKDLKEEKFILKWEQDLQTTKYLIISKQFVTILMPGLFGYLPLSSLFSTASIG